MIDFLIGPLVGAIGGVATQWMAYKSKGLDIEDRKHQRESDLKMSIIQHRQALEITKAESEAAERKIVLEGEVQANVRDLDNLAAAMATMPAWSGIKEQDGTGLRWFKTIIEALQTLVRVFLTIFLGWKLAMLTADVQVMIGGIDSAVLAPKIVEDAAALVLRGFVEISLTAIGFWFGSRGAVLKQQYHGDRAKPVRD